MHQKKGDSVSCISGGSSWVDDTSHEDHPGLTSKSFSSRPSLYISIFSSIEQRHLSASSGSNHYKPSRSLARNDWSQVKPHGGFGGRRRCHKCILPIIMLRSNIGLSRKRTVMVATLATGTKANCYLWKSLPTLCDNEREEVTNEKRVSFSCAARFGLRLVLSPL